MINALLSVTFACGLIIAALHVLNRRFIAPVYDVVLNLVAFVSAVITSVLLHHWMPAVLSGFAVAAWVLLAVRTWRAGHHGVPRTGQVGRTVPLGRALPVDEPAAASRGTQNSSNARA